MTKPMIMVAPNGARRRKQDHAALPISISETVETARACFAVGASALHLHVRDNKGGHSLDSGRYREALAELNRTVPAMRIQITTEAVGIYSVADQLRCLEEVKPEWASISIREIARSPELAKTVYETCTEMETEVQHILYDEEDARLLGEWLSNGIVRAEQNSVLLVLGRYSEGQTSSTSEIGPFVNSLPGISMWMLCAFGPQEHECLVEAARLGGDCRVGFENSLVDVNGTPWTDNATSVSALGRKLDQDQG